METVDIHRKDDTSGNPPGDNRRGNNGGTAEEKEPKKRMVRNAQKIDNPLPPRLLSLKAAAVYMGRTTWGMRELYWANKIPWLRDGKRIYFDLRDLDAYIEGMKTNYA